MVVRLLLVVIDSFKDVYPPNDGIVEVTTCPRFQLVK